VTRARPPVRAHHQYAREGLLALDPRAFFGFFFEPPTRENTLLDNVAIVDITGPLEHHGGWWCDSYDGIVERVAAACESPAHTVLLKVDSPGGLVSGMCEASRAIRATCQAAGKRLVAYVDGMACSAAYALASSAERIVVPETGFVGSIGVINTRIDARKNAEMCGVGYHVITSGARKADGHPHTAMSEAELAATQGTVDSLADVFFRLVEEMRGISAQAVHALQAQIFHGEAAVAAGLADQVQSFDDLLAALASPNEERDMTIKGSKYSEGRAALEEAAKGEGEEAEKAKRALAAMDETDESDAESDDAPADDEGEDEAAAESEDDEEEEEKPAASRAGGRVSARTAGELGGTANKLAGRVAQLETKLEAADRKEFLASRPDLEPALVKVLEKKPLAEVRAIVNAIKKPKAPKLGERASTIAPKATRGEGQGTGAAGETTDPELAAVDRAMGLGAKSAPKVEIRGNTLYLGRAPTNGKV
jgi:signal peptide peptidase SppA